MSVCVDYAVSKTILYVYYLFVSISSVCELHEDETLVHGVGYGHGFLVIGVDVEALSLADDALTDGAVDADGLVVTWVDHANNGERLGLLAGRLDDLLNSLHRLDRTLAAVGVALSHLDKEQLSIVLYALLTALQKLYKIIQATKSHFLRNRVTNKTKKYYFENHLFLNLVASRM